MAKYRHRTFEMYDFREEAIDALTPRSSRFESQASDPEDWKFERLDVSLADNVTAVLFTSEQFDESKSELDLRNDFAELATKLGNNSKVLLDFTGIESFSASAIQAIVLLNNKLQNKGSRIALCCLSPSVRAAFFPPAKA